VCVCACVCVCEWLDIEVMGDLMGTYWSGSDLLYLNSLQVMILIVSQRLEWYGTQYGELHLGNN
jgi:hypothetical protein